MIARRAALGAAAAIAMAGSPWRASASSPSGSASLARPASLAIELQRALASRKALLVMVSLDGCPYCRLVRESYLLPLHDIGQPVVQIELAASIPLLDLRGRASTHAQVIRDLDIRLAPAVLFLGLGGAEAAPRLLGVASPDFYGAYLQERVEAANRSVAA